MRLRRLTGCLSAKCAGRRRRSADPHRSRPGQRDLRPQARLRRRPPRPRRPLVRRRHEPRANPTPGRRRPPPSGCCCETKRNAYASCAPPCSTATPKCGTASANNAPKTPGPRHQHVGSPRRRRRTRPSRDNTRTCPGPPAVPGMHDDNRRRLLRAVIVEDQPGSSRVRRWTLLEAAERAGPILNHTSRGPSGTARTEPAAGVGRRRRGHRRGALVVAAAGPQRAGPPRGVSAHGRARCPSVRPGKRLAFAKPTELLAELLLP
jgi:hypothetical protein